MINCIIVDDDPSSQVVVRHFVESTAGMQLLESFGMAVDASNYLHKSADDIDLVFLDVEMPGLTGFELMSSIQSFPPVIFISGFEKHALQAIYRRAVSFLVKPLNYGNFLQAVEPVFQKQIPAQKQTDYLFVKENGVTNRIKYEDILYFESMGDYVKVHTKESIHVVYTTMRSIEDKLKKNPSFVRIHRQYQINVKYLERFDFDMAVVGNRTVPIGSKYRPELQNKLMII